MRLAAASKEAAETLELKARLSVMETGSYSPLEVVTKSKPSQTLKGALQLAWSSQSGRRGGWSSQKSGEQSYGNAKECMEVLGMERKCSSVTRNDMDKLVDTFRKLGLSNNTIRNKVGCFYKALDYAVREGWMNGRPHFERPAPGVPREFLLSIELENKLLAFFEPTDREFADFCRVGVETGLRLMELAKAEAWQVSLESGMFNVPAARSKSGRARNVVLSDKAKEILSTYMFTKDPITGELVAKKPKDRVWRSIKKDFVSYHFKRMKDALGYNEQKDFVFHTLRHTRATRLAAKSKSPFVVMDQMGHADIKTSMRYIHMAKAMMDTESWRNA